MKELEARRARSKAKLGKHLAELCSFSEGVVST